MRISDWSSDVCSSDLYAANHIPGALSAPYAQWRGPADNPGQLPTTDKLAELVRNSGVEKDIHAVVVSSGANSTAFGISARVYWTLNSRGLSALWILNGGLKAGHTAALAQKTALTPVGASHAK